MVAPAKTGMSCSGEDGNVLQHLVERFDDDFLRVVDLVHHQAELVLAGLQDHDVDDAGGLGDRQFQLPVQVHDGQ